jgi:hypothetical protein
LTLLLFAVILHHFNQGGMSFSLPPSYVATLPIANQNFFALPTTNWYFANPQSWQHPNIPSLVTPTGTTVTSGFFPPKRSEGKGICFPPAGKQQTSNGQLDAWIAPSSDVDYDNTINKAVTTDRRREKPFNCCKKSSIGRVVI